MADSKLTALGNLAAPTRDDLLYVVDDPAGAPISYKATVQGVISGPDLFVAASNASANSIKNADYVCDGTADDVQIQAAIDALPAAGGRVVLSEGNFYIAATINIRHQLWLSGSGIHATQLYLIDGVDDNMIEYDHGGDGVTLWLTLEQMTLSGNKANQAAGHGIYIPAAPDTLSDVRLRDMYILNFKEDGIHLLYNWNYKLDNLVVEYNDGYGLYLAAGNEATIKGCHITSNTLSGVYSASNQYRTTFLGGEYARNGEHGIHIVGPDNAIIGATFVDNSQTVANTSSDVRAYPSNIKVIGCNFLATTDSKYHVSVVATTTGMVVVGNTFGGAATAPMEIAGATIYAHQNAGYVMPGEIRSSWGTLTAGNANAICFAWHNPEAQDILIKKVIVEVTTAGGTPGSHLDVGIADDAAGTNRGTEFFDDLLLNSAQVDDSWVGGDGGTQTKWVFCQDSVSATDGWVVGQILDANAASLVGRYYIEYAGR